MSLRTIPVFETTLELSIADAFAAASEFALGFSIRRLDRERLRIVLDLTSMPKPALFFTWTRAYVIRVYFVDENLSRVRVFGKKVLSPHHLFRIPHFLAHRIDPEKLHRELLHHFSRYDAVCRTTLCQER